MPRVPRAVLYSFFPKGGKPTEAQFKTLIDSGFNFSDDIGLLGLNNFDSGLAYKQNDTAVENKIIYQAKVDINAGFPFNPAQWERIAGGTTGSLLFKGPWDALNDSPQLASPTPIPPAGEFYVVSTAGNTSLSGITGWGIGDWAISGGTEWFKIDNSDFVTGAQNVGAGEGIFKNEVGTTLYFKSLTNLDGSVNIAPDTDSIDLSVAFDDAGTSPLRTWSAFKTSNELATKEPTIAATGNTDDFWDGTKTFSNILSKIRSTTLAGLSLATNQIISASDTILQAFGYLQKQISDNLSTLTSHITNVSNPHNVTKAQVGLSEVPNLKENLSATVNPATSDDSSLGYAIGSTWINVPTRKSFICVNAGVGVASWIETTNVVPSVFGNDYWLVESFTVIQTAVVKPLFANYNYPPATPGGTFVLSTGTRNGLYRIQWSCLIQTGTRAGQFQLKNITSALPQVVATVDVEGKTTNDVISVGWTGNVALTGVNQDFVIQFNTQLAGQPVIILQARIEIWRVPTPIP